MKYSKRNQKDIILLLCCLLVVSGAISLLYGTSEASHAVSAINDNEVMRDIQPLDISGSVKAMGEFLTTLSLDQQLRILERIFNGKVSALTPEQKVELGIELLVKQAATNQQDRILKTLIQYSSFSKTPLLYIAVNKKLSQAVPTITRFLKNDPAKLHDAIYKALLFAIQKDNVPNFDALIQELKGITPAMATDLLWDVLQENKDEKFIPILAGQKADLNSSKEGKTPLVAAVDANNAPLVNALLEKGADVNKFIDPAVGTPLQNALRKKYSSIELLLRKHGARE